MDINRFAVENFASLKEQFAADDAAFCACGDLATTVKPGPHTGKPFHLCAGCSTLWTEQRLGIAQKAGA